MIPGLDSATLPTAAQAQAAAASGVRLWSGYLQTKPNMGLFSPWTRAAFDNARLCGSIPIAFCSGWDDPVACRALAIAWNVRLCLDVEGGIRGDGPWVQPWLIASGAGLYGNAPVHPGRTAAFHILAAYPGFNPNATWSGARPLVPCGWQWQGTHSEFGVGVDRGWYDDWFQSKFGPDPGNLTFEEDMIYVGPIHPLPVTLKVFSAGSDYRDPAVSALVAGNLAAGTMVGFSGYLYSSSPVQSADLGGGVPGPDYVWWLATSGQWVPDAILDTSSIAAAPKPGIPTTEPLSLYFAKAGSGSGTPGPKGDQGIQGIQGIPGPASTVPGPKGDKGDVGVVPDHHHNTATTGPMVP